MNVFIYSAFGALLVIMLVAAGIHINRGSKKRTEEATKQDATVAEAQRLYDSIPAATAAKIAKQPTQKKREALVQKSLNKQGVSYDDSSPALNLALFSLFDTQTTPDYSGDGKHDAVYHGTTDNGYTDSTPTHHAGYTDTPSYTDTNDYSSPSYDSGSSYSDSGSSDSGGGDSGGGGGD